MQPVKRIEILGCPVDAVSLRETMARIAQSVRDNLCLKVATANVDFVMKARRDPAFADDLSSADLVVADGVPILWAAAMLGEELKGRVNGTDLVLECAALSARTGWKVALIGSGPGVADLAAAKMQIRWPAARFQVVPTPHPLTEADNEGLVEKVREAEAKILLVALGAPHQERWIRRNLSRCQANAGVGIGSALDIISGVVPRAPLWMRNNGLEWLHRMRHEPRRLGKRYLVEDAPFLLHLGAEVLKRRFGLRGAP